MAKTRNLTKGNIVKNLIFFAIPLLLSSLVQQLYNTVDLIFVGNMISKSASAAIGASSLLITCLVGFFGGMSVGTGVVVSHIFGAKDYEKLSRAVHNAIAFSLVGGFFFVCRWLFVCTGIFKLDSYTGGASCKCGGLSADLLYFICIYVCL